MASVFATAELAASPLEPQAPPLQFPFEELQHDNQTVDDWLAGIEPGWGGVNPAAPLMLATEDPSIPPSRPPHLCVLDNKVVLDDGLGGNTDDSTRLHSSGSLKFEDEDFGPLYSPASLALADSKPARERTAKPAPQRRRKTRPKAQLETLQKQLDDIMVQVEELTLVNTHLHCKNDVLGSLLQCADEVAKVTASAQQQYDACLRGSAGPHPALVVAMRDLTPQSWRACYNAKVAEISQWLVLCDGFSSGDSVGARQKLAEATGELVMYFMHCFHLRMDVMTTAVTLSEQLVANTPQQHKEHWSQVVRLMELTPEQERQIVYARDVYLRCDARLARERQGLGGAVAYRQVDCGVSILHNESLLQEVTQNMFKSHQLIKGLAMWLYRDVFTPLQTAKCILHTHPMPPFPVLMLNAVAFEVEARQEPAVAPGSRPPLHGSKVEAAAWLAGWGSLV